jgi:SAM-dependent methyltransferase
MSSCNARASAVASAYYDSSDADCFYAAIWGGEDIHIGIYHDPQESIAAASARTVTTLMELAGGGSPDWTVVDLGAGYGGASRRLANSWGCRVEAVNISSVENGRHRALNRAAGLEGRIRVHDASFEACPLEDGCADLAWSQDAILHAGDRQEVLREVKRLLRPGGAFVFTDPMAADGVDSVRLRPILERIHLGDLGSPSRYRAWAEQAGLVCEHWSDHTDMLVSHYTRVREELRRRRDELAATINCGYLDRMDAGLGHWIEGGQAGLLSWGLMRLRRPAGPT